MLADGYKVKVEANEDGQEKELVFASRDFERKFFSDETNRSFIDCFLDRARRDPIIGKIGKTICFAVSLRHPDRGAAGTVQSRRIAAARSTFNYYDTE